MEGKAEEMFKDSGTIKRSIIGCLILLASAFPVYASTARAWGKVGTATTTNATLTCTFNPKTLAVCNTETAGGTAFFIDFTDGIATTDDNSTNIKILANTCHTWTFSDPNVLNEFTIGVITASSTAAYTMEAVR